MIKDNERTKAQLSNYIKRTMKSPGQPLPEESAKMFVWALASKDINIQETRTHHYQWQCGWQHIQWGDDTTGQARFRGRGLILRNNHYDNCQLSTWPLPNPRH
jgi:hypothetical protein